MGETLRDLERVRDKGFKILKENLTPVELVRIPTNYKQWNRRLYKGKI